MSRDRRILVVDDEPRVLDLVGSLLETEGLSFDLANGARKALALAEKTDYPLVITDLRMPHISGLDLVARLRKSRPDARFLVMSACLEDLARAPAEVRTAIDGAIGKPWDEEDLMSKVRGALTLHAARMRTARGSGAGHQRWGNVLVLEDNPLDARLVENLLSRSIAQDGEIEIAGTLATALEAARARPFSIALTDLSLPDADGTDAVEKLLAHTDLPVVVLTGHEDDQLALTAVQMGAQDYLCKNGLTATVLERAVRYALERHRAQVRYRELLSINPDGMLVVDRDGTILFANPSAAELFARDPDELRGEDFGFPMNSSDPTEIQLHEGRCVEMRVADAEWQGGSAYVVALRDVTSRKRIEQELSYLAHHDQLTGLVNRACLDDRLGHAIARNRRRGSGFAILLVDLDGFKLVNDTLGHAAGDELLREVAARLRRGVRLSDTVGRLGGDEFVLIVELVHDEGDARIVAQKLLRDLRRPFEIRERQVHVTGSIGIALYPRDGENVDTLLKKADTAMYSAKREGRSCFRFFDDGVQWNLVKRLSREAELRGAVERSEFVVAYQPQVGPGGMIGAEALVRWQHPREGLLPPAEFISLLEETGLVKPVELHVFRMAARQARRWRETGWPELRISVNISTRHLLDSGFERSVQQILREEGVPASALEIEITESLLIRDTNRAKGTISRLQDIGVRVSLDDFGTGYSSLSYLREFCSVDALKIDQSFIRCLSESSEDASIVASIIDLAHGLGFEVVAEGVETPEQLRLLGMQGCDLFQGFLFSRPLAADAWQDGTSHLQQGEPEWEDLATSLN